LHVLDVAGKADTMGKALSAFGELVMEPRPADEDCLVETATQMVVIQLTHE
jgi:hypothetical protein